MQPIVAEGGGAALSPKDTTEIEAPAVAEEGGGDEADLSRLLNVPEKPSEGASGVELDLYCFIMHDVHKQTAAQIATNLGLTQDAVRNRLKKGSKFGRAGLQDRVDEKRRADEGLTARQAAVTARLAAAKTRRDEAAAARAEREAEREADRATKPRQPWRVNFMGGPQTSKTLSTAGEKAGWERRKQLLMLFTIN